MIAATNDKKAHLLCFQLGEHLPKSLKAKQAGNYSASTPRA
jgi:hypothetical protein